MGCCYVQADVDLVGIMRRTGFLPSVSQQPGAASLVTQGGSRVGQVKGAGGRQASDGALQNEDTAKGGWQADALSPPQAAAAAATVSANAGLYNNDLPSIDVGSYASAVPIFVAALVSSKFAPPLTEV